MKKLIKNAAKCLKCDTIIESTHRHDYKSCKCGNIAVDGGLNYTRRIGNVFDKSSYEEMCEYAILPNPPKPDWAETMTDEEWEKYCNDMQP